MIGDVAGERARPALLGTLAASVQQPGHGGQEPRSAMWSGSSAHADLDVTAPEAVIRAAAATRGPPRAGEGA